MHNSDLFWKQLSTYTLSQEMFFDMPAVVTRVDVMSFSYVLSIFPYVKKKKVYPSKGA